MEALEEAIAVEEKQILEVVETMEETVEAMEAVEEKETTKVVETVEEKIWMLMLRSPMRRDMTSP